MTRLRDLGVELGEYAPGPLNAITDVDGVAVGHATVMIDDDMGRPIARTGVTAIHPNGGDIFTDRVVGNTFVLNGAGEMSGLIQVTEWGLIETPILLTNTLSVGRVSAATVQHMVQRYPSIGRKHDVIIPVVGECDDSFLNDIAGHHVQPQHVFEALDSASNGPVDEGNVGGGTGMVSFGLKGGIGTASRCLPEAEGAFRVGVLVMNNFGRLEDLRVDGMAVGRVLRGRDADLGRHESRYGSIITVVATDAPLNSHQVGRLCKRAALGIGRVGSYAAHGSGELIIGFSTGNTVPRDPAGRLYSVTLLADHELNPLYRAVIECTEEAILNALCAAEPMVGFGGHRVEELPHDLVAEMARRRAAMLEELT